MVKSASIRPRLLIIGVGNAYRGDDAVGLIVARRLGEENLDGVTILEQSGEGAALIESWKDADTVILIDAVHSGAEPGTIYRFDAHTQPIPNRFFRYSTHAFSVAEAIELARTLNQLPARLIVYGVEGKFFGVGDSLSPEVEKAAQHIVERVRQEVRFIDKP
jgi:hydrogenase maturation protease